MATPRSRSPSATRGSGARGALRATAKSVGGERARCPAAPPARAPRRPASRHVDVVAGAARRTRVIAVPAGTSPMIVTQRLRGPRVVSPPISATPKRSASANRPRANASSQRSSTSGSAPASSAQRGVAPIAAMSDRLTASVLCPSVAGSTSGEEMPAFDQHVDGEHEVAAGRGRDHRAIVADADAHRGIARARGGSSGR